MSEDDVGIKRYYKKYAESQFGTGVGYAEFTGRRQTRQVEIYRDGDVWLWGDEAHPENLGDQPLERLDLTEEDRISAEEFEDAWRRALGRNPPRE